MMTADNNVMLGRYEYLRTKFFDQCSVVRAFLGASRPTSDMSVLNNILSAAEREWAKGEIYLECEVKRQWRRRE